MVRLQRVAHRREDDVVDLLLRGRIDYRDGAAHPVRHVRLRPLAVEGDAIRIERLTQFDRGGHRVRGGVDHRYLVAGRVLVRADGERRTSKVVGNVQSIAQRRRAEGYAGGEVSGGNLRTFDEA